MVPLNGSGFIGTSGVIDEESLLDGTALVVLVARYQLQQAQPVGHVVLRFCAVFLSVSEGSPRNCSRSFAKAEEDTPHLL